MKRKLTGSAYSLILAMIVGLALVLFALNWPFASKLLPMIFGGTIFVLAAIQFGFEVSRGKEEPILTKDIDESEGEITTRAFLLVSGWIVGFVVAIYLLGFVIAIPLFLAMYMKTHRTSWLTSILIAVIATAIIYFLFQVGLQIELYPGLIPKFY